MKKWMTIGIALVGLLAGAACTRGDQDRARDQREKAQRQLDETRDKLRQDLKRADQQTREDLDKARDQINHAIDQSKQDADKARERLREHDNNPPQQ
ncbi:MAG TPA: hypothetical protein VFW44_19380 [Bryobacteraceae bacterium]|nr:hypothetical protein [Bryobacteraceae bacterium]